MPYDLNYYLQLSYEHERQFRIMQAKWNHAAPCWDTSRDESYPVQNDIARYFYFRNEPIPALEKEAV